MGPAQEGASTSSGAVAPLDQQTARGSDGRPRRSIYQSLPLYSRNGWRTRAPPIAVSPSQQPQEAERLCPDPGPSFPSGTLPQPMAITNRRERRKSGKNRKKKSGSSGDLASLLLAEVTAGGSSRSVLLSRLAALDEQQMPEEELFAFSSLRQKRQLRRGRLILLLLISGSLLLLLFSLSLILGPTLFFRRNNYSENANPILPEEQQQQFIREELGLGRLKTAYSDIRPNEEQIWLLNAHEFRRRHRRTAPQPGELRNLFGLARVCGPFCSVRLRHGVGPGGEPIRADILAIRLRRLSPSPLPPDSNPGQSHSTPSAALDLPLVLTMESANQTHVRPSQISPGCFYSAEVEQQQGRGHRERQSQRERHREREGSASVVNLCDRNGGLFGTLALFGGAFLIEPLVDIGAPEGKRVIGRRRRHISTSGRRGGMGAATADLRAHLIYPLQTQHFGDDQAGASSRRGTASGEAGTAAGDSSQSTEESQEEATKDEWHWPAPTNTTAARGRPVPPKGARARRAAAGGTTVTANSWDHFVEVLAVADHRMLMYHQTNLENYVLTLFSTVSSIYRHSSLGASVNVIVVRLVILKNERPGPLISNRAQETLQNFCQWQQIYNDRNEDSLNHHDVAILLTRHDICRATNKCDTLGLAELGTMCDTRKSCAIIEDNGLSAAFTIAHELGHIFNIPHDDERKCGEYMPLNKANYHIMAPTLEYNTNPWSWSPCSSAMLSRFLDSRRGQTQCILDQPVQRRYYDRMFETPAPGATVSVSQQCKYVFGASAEICPYMPTCRRLWCSVSYGYQMGCRTQHMPWADGTQCAENMWCHRGQCVGMSPLQRVPVDGGWGKWTDLPECSRTCGGGVQRSFRECDNPPPENGGKFCVGQRVRFQPCNTQECAWDMPGFRELQCNEFDGKDIGIHGVPKETRWVPKYTGVADNERCRLYCRAADSAAFYLLREKVVDGTPCDRNGDDICIDGSCHRAGCDHQLGSEVRRDICGVCAGDGSSCREVSGLFNDRGTFGYNEVLRIPAGAANVEVTQTAHNGLKDDDNYLALRLGNGEFLLNGQYQVSVFRQQISVLDTVLEYSGSDSVVERLNGTGPLRTDLHVHVLSVGNLHPPNIHYRFMEPSPGGAGAQNGQQPGQQQYQQQRQQQQPVRPPAAGFQWRQTEEQWTKCSLTCQGTQSQQPVCLDLHSGRPVEDRHCAGLDRPEPRRRTCNVDCFYKWQQRLLGPDPAGRRRQQDICVRSYTNGGREEQAKETECQAAGVKIPPRPNALSHAPPAQQPQPLHRQQHQPHQLATDRRWVYSEWSACSESCGNGGLSRRALHCLDARDGSRLDSRFCEGIPHEPTQTECNRTPCPRWAFGQWSECSLSCGGGIRLRHAQCQDAAGRDLPEQMCPAAEKENSQKCNERACTRWQFGPWSQCSVSCGQGVERREARCVASADGRLLEESACDPRERIVEKMCQLAGCPKWHTGSWSQCSLSCGSDGFQSRLVQCVDSVGRKLPDQRCQTAGKGELRPQTHKVCSGGPCPRWRTGEWTVCSVSCGQGVRERQVDCVLGAHSVDDSLCPELQRPTRHERCALLACALWNAEPWEPCSASCGGWGVQSRAVHCVRQTSSRTQGNRSIVVHDRECHKGQKPRTERSCERLACAQQQKAHWSAGPWEPCPASCAAASGEQTAGGQSGPAQQRRVVCEWENGTAASEPEKHCGAQPRPDEWRPCSGLAACPPPAPPAAGGPHKKEEEDQNDTGKTRTAVGGRWEAGDWSPCSVSCGGGWRRRSVFCNSANDTLGPCAPGQRPSQFEQCATGECPARGQWQAGPWSACAPGCAPAEQTRPVWCRSAANPLLKLDQKDCAGSERPIASRPCASREEECSSASSTAAPAKISTREATSEESSPPPTTEAGALAATSPAEFRWDNGPWSACPLRCGPAGPSPGGPPSVRTRRVRCMDDSGRQVEEANCLGSLAQRPPTELRCRQTAAECPRWQKAKWGLCSASCGPGVSRRDVHCRKGRGGAQLVPESECLAVEPKPFETRKCELSKCPAYAWRVGPWSKCMDQCKAGEQRRRVFCMSELGKRAAAKMCASGNSSAVQPTETRKCPTDKCPYHWVAGPWSTCSRTCGTGFHFRRIECKLRKSVARRDADSSQQQAVPPPSPANWSIGVDAEPTVQARMCMALEKPMVSKQCEMNACDAEFQWSVSPWSQCSKNCGPGFRRRKVRCLDRRGQRTAKDLCDPKNRPKRRESCFLRNCLPSDCAELRAQSQTNMMDGNYSVLVAGFRVQVYCHLMNLTIPKTFLNVPPETNFAEFYGKRLLYPFSCPHNGLRNDSCACSSHGHVNQGLSRFRKVRVDLQNMKINPLDHSFARTEHGTPVAYGTAGDCYSMSDCPQGRFSIDLRGTGLRLVDDLQWTDQGHRTSSRIERAENNALVQGFCGGYCGECAPDRFKGLVLEVDDRRHN